MNTGIGNPYLGYVIYQFNPSSEEQVQTLVDLEEERNDGVIFLTKSFHSAVGTPTDVMVKPGLKEEFVTKLKAKELDPQCNFTVRNSYTELRQRVSSQKSANATSLS